MIPVERCFLVLYVDHMLFIQYWSYKVIFMCRLTKTIVYVYNRLQNLSQNEAIIQNLQFFSFKVFSLDSL